MNEHFVGESCADEWCAMCNEYTPPARVPATHKIGEESTTLRYATPEDGGLFDQGSVHIAKDAYEMVNIRHNLTAYVCCEHFCEVMGEVARKWCGIDQGVRAL